MKHFSKQLFATALLLISLSQNSQILAQTTTSTIASTRLITQTSTATVTTAPQISKEATPLNQLTKATQGLQLQQNGETLSIFYQRSIAQQKHKIQYAVWSEENGQDDLHWYVANDNQTNISLTNHKGYGKYHVHAYILAEGKNHFLQATSFELNKSQPILTTALSEPGYLDIQVQHLPIHTVDVRIPIWTLNKGQDDLQWYSANYDRSTRTCHLRVPLKNHHFETGVYAVHLYLTENQQSQYFVSKTEVTVSSTQISTQTAPNIAITNLNTIKGTYQVTIREQATTKIIKSVDVATWSMEKQENLVWRAAERANGGFLAKVDFQNHQGHNGHYQNHVYVTYVDGSRRGYIAQIIDLTKARLPIQLSTRLLGVGHKEVIFKNIYDDLPVQFAVWSAENGQDDLQWYTAIKISDKTYKGSIPLNKHKGVGLYYVHVYQNQGLAAFDIQVSADERKTIKAEANTYPIGQCTWGAKEEAPWVGNWWGNANMWPDSARKRNFKIGSTPKVGAVISWTSGVYGHVAVVTEVASPTRIRVREANYAGRMYVNDFRGWFNPFNDGPHVYIYPN